MRFVFLFIFALALGTAHADGPGQWEQVEQQQPQDIPGDYDEYYLDDDQGDVYIQQEQNNVTIIENNITINNYVQIDVNVYPDAPAILPLPWGPRPAPVNYCFTRPQPWGWTFYALTWDGTVYTLAHVGDPGAYWNMHRHLYLTGQCPRYY